MENERSQKSREANENTPVVGPAPAIFVSILILAVLLIFP
jgi:hypothetical protein